MFSLKNQYQIKIAGMVYMSLPTYAQSNDCTKYRLSIGACSLPRGDVYSLMDFKITGKHLSVYGDFAYIIRNDDGTYRCDHFYADWREEWYYHRKLYFHSLNEVIVMINLRSYEQRSKED